MAPETVFGHEYNKAVDWWAMGIIIYEMLSGKNPIKQRVKGGNAKEEKIYIPQEQKFAPLTKSLLEGLLQKDPNQRLGSKGIE